MVICLTGQPQRASVDTLTSWQSMHALLRLASPRRAPVISAPSIPVWADHLDFGLGVEHRGVVNIYALRQHRGGHA